MRSHSNICSELTKPCSYLSKDPSHHSFNQVHVKDKNLRLFHRVYNSKPTVELCSNDQLIKCLIDTRNDRTIIKFKKLLEPESEPKISLSNIQVQDFNSSAHVVGETEFCLKLLPEKVVAKPLAGRKGSETLCQTTHRTC